MERGSCHARRQRPCAADRGGWLDRPHSACDQGYERLGITVRLHHERRGTPQVDAGRTEGQVDLRLRLPVEAAEQHVVDDAHHVDHGIVPAEQVGQHPDETASHWRTAVVQIRPHEHLVHQHRDHRRGRIRRREDATIGERDAQRLDITRGHDARECARDERLAASRRHARQVESPAIDEVSERRHAARACRAHPGRAAHALEHRDQELFGPIRLAVLLGDGDVGHQDVGRVVARVHIEERHQASGEEGGADEQDDREGALDDQETPPQATA